MAVTVADVSTPLGTKLVIDSTTDTNSNAAEDNVVSGATTVYYVEIDNTANASASYLKLYNHAAPTEGTTPPDVALRATANARDYFVFPTGIAFATALSYICTTAAGTGATTDTAPSQAVTVRFLTS